MGVARSARPENGRKVENAGKKNPAGLIFNFFLQHVLYHFFYNLKNLKDLNNIIIIIILIQNLFKGGYKPPY